MVQKAISTYFSEGGRKTTLNSMMYNFYTRRITSYKIFLYKLFPKDSCATNEKDTHEKISRKRNISMKVYRRAIKARYDAVIPTNVGREDAEIHEAYVNDDNDDISFSNVRLVP